MTVTTLNPYEPEDNREATLWMSAVLVVCVLHIGLAATYWLLKPEPEARAEAPVIDVAFVPATATPAPTVPETQPVDQPPIPDQPEPPPTKEESTVQPTPEVQPAPEPPPQVEALVQPEPPPPPLALTMPEFPAETKVPDQVAVVPPPEAVPAEVVPQPEKPVVPPPPVRKPVHEEKVEKRPPPPKPAVALSSKAARVAMAPNPGAASEGAREGRTSWLSELVAHIRRFATYNNSQSNESGSVNISVTIDRNGRLKSRRLASSSGSATLDRMAMEILERAQPFPPFPPSMTEAQTVQTIPLHLRPH